MSKPDLPRIASAARGIRHVFIRNLELPAHIGVYNQDPSSRLRKADRQVDKHLRPDNVFRLNLRLIEVVDNLKTLEYLGGSDNEDQDGCERFLPHEQHKDRHYNDQCKQIAVEHTQP